MTCTFTIGTKAGHKGHGYSHAGTALVNAEENFDISEKERKYHFFS